MPILTAIGNMRPLLESLHDYGRKKSNLEDYFDAMPGVDTDKQIDQLVEKSPDIYPLVERSRIADASFGSD